MPATGRVDVTVNMNLTNALDLGVSSAPSLLKFLGDFATSGVGLNQVDDVWADKRTLAQGANEDLDLSGASLVNGLGVALAFARIKVIAIKNLLSAGALNIIVGGAAATQFLSWVGAATHTVTVRPGGLLLLAAPDATAYVTAAGASDLLRIAASAGSGSVDYEILLAGGKS